MFNFTDQAGSDFDAGLDATKLLNPSVSLYTMLEDKMLAIQALSVNDDEYALVRLEYYVPKAGIGTYQLTVDGLSNFATFGKVRLADATTGEVHLLEEGTELLLAMDELSNNDRFSLLIERGRVTGIDEPATTPLWGYGTTVRQHIYHPAQSGAAKVMIYGMDGKTVFDQTVSFVQGRGTIAADLLPQQLYILHVGGVSRKFIVRH